MNDIIRGKNMRKTRLFSKIWGDILDPGENDENVPHLYRFFSPGWKFLVVSCYFMSRV